MKPTDGIAAIAFMVLALNSPALGQESGWREEGSVVHLRETTDKVGIGTDAPDNILHLATPSANRQLLKFASSHNSLNNLYMGFYLQNATPSEVLYTQIAASNPVRTAGAETGEIRFNVKDAGSWASRVVIRGSNMGIGTGNPQELLHGYKDQNALSMFEIENPNAGAYAAAQIKFTSEGGSSIIYRTSDAYFVGTIQDALVIQEGGGGDIALYGAAEIARFTNGGNVGIGTAGPQNKLDVEGSAVIGASYSGTNTAPSNGLLVQGNVGIGTTGPGAKLEVAGNLFLSKGADRTIKIPQAATATAGDHLIIQAGQGNNDSSPTGDGGNLYLRAGDTKYSPMGKPKGGDVYIYGGNDGGNGINLGNVILAHTGTAAQGNVGIGTTNPGSYKLAVNGKIRAKDVVVETGWSDFVFDDDYRLKPLQEVETFIQTHKHLPDIPSAGEVSENGVALGDMQAKLLQKIEELMLYVIELDKENQALTARVAELEK